MQHVQLGRTGLQVSRLCLGTMTFGLQCDEATSRAILDTAAESGITFIDTADVYPLGGTLDTVGRTEEIIGRWLRGRRDQFILATKCANKVGPAPWQQGVSRKHVLWAIDASLKRLGTDYVDLYQIHHYDRADTDRGIPRSARYRRAQRQGALRRVLEFPCMADRPGARKERNPQARPLRDGAAALQPALSPDRARVAAAMSRGRAGRASRTIRSPAVC